MTLPVPVVVGVDAGTTSAKAVVVAEGGLMAEGASDPIATSAPRVGASEQDPAEITAAVAAATRVALSRCDQQFTVEAICLAAQSGSVVPVGRGDERFPARTWMDTRGQSAVDSWTEDQRTSVRLISGWAPGTGLGLSTIAAMELDGERDVQRWASVDDHLVHELTGEWLTNPSNAAGMQLMDVALRSWSDELCGLASVDTSQLSVIGPSAGHAGTVGSRGAAFGLPEHTPVIVGGHDQACAAFGLGALVDGDMVLSAGTAWVLSIICPALPVESLAARYNLSPHVTDGQWSASTLLGPLGAMIADHLVEPVAAQGRLLTPPEADAPFFVFDPSRSAMSGWGSFVDSAGGRTSVERHMMLRAVFEACSFAVRAALDDAPLDVGDRPLIFVGGGTRSADLCQLMADTTGRDVHALPEASWPAIGAARLAARAVGWRDLTITPTEPRRFTPRSASAKAVSRRYMIHRQLSSGELR